MEPITIALSSNRFRGIEFEFSRINVFMGANGVGKSSILTELSRHDSLLSRVKFIEGGRVVQISNLEPTQREFDSYGSFEKTDHNYKQQRSGRLQSRIKAGLIRLNQMEKKFESEHSRSVQDWQSGGEQGESPKIKASPLIKLFSRFSDIFPDITLSVTGGNKTLRCNQNGVDYGANQLSDGEKQVLSLLADLLSTEEDIDTIFVDEPELNLNPSLAIKFWSMLENELENIRFIYATHNLSFALRGQVGRLFILDKTDTTLSVFNSFADLNESQASHFLGSIPSIVITKNAVLVEGEDKSFDNPFYSWLINGDVDYKVFPSGDCESVLSTLRNNSLWSKLAPNAKIQGIIDRDYKDARSVERISGGHEVLILKYHEAESYLCHPVMLAILSASIGNLEEAVTEGVVLDNICEFVELNLARIALTRSIYLNNPLNLEKSIYSVIPDVKEMRNFIAHQCKQQSFDEKILAKTTSAFDSQVTRIEKSIADRDVDKLLHFAPGKELLGKLTHLIELKNSEAVLNAAKTHLTIANFPHLNDLRERIIALS